jgi:hypothetical protein
MPSTSAWVYDPNDGKLWLQYWLFYYYNSFQRFGVGNHEGDWEMVQVGMDGNQNPDSVTFAAHDSAYGCGWSQVDHGGPSGDQPIAYVAARSHAAYPHSGSTETIPFLTTDDHRGDGVYKVLPAESMRTTDRWTGWKGRWGASRSDAFPNFPSPPNPSQQGEKWSAPSAFHSNARDC